MPQVVCNILKAYIHSEHRSLWREDKHRFITIDFNFNALLSWAFLVGDHPFLDFRSNILIISLSISLAILTSFSFHDQTDESCEKTWIHGLDPMSTVHSFLTPQNRIVLIVIFLAGHELLFHLKKQLLFCYPMDELIFFFFLTNCV